MLFIDYIQLYQIITKNLHKKMTSLILGKDQEDWMDHLAYLK